MEKEEQPKSWYIAAARSPEGKQSSPSKPSPALGRAKIQAQVLVPVLKAFRDELGAERADRIAWKALAEWRRQIITEEPVAPGEPTEQFRTRNVAVAALIGDAVDVQMLKDEPESIEFNVTGCRFAQFFRELGEPELGFALTCSWDNTVAEEIGAGDVKLTRTGTIMQGANHCDFRYALKKTGRA
jgi:hypothetical protein